MTERQPHVLIAGGGIAGAEAALALHALATERVSITLLAPTPTLRYRPLTVLEPFEPTAHVEVPLSELAADTRATLRAGALARVEPETLTAWTTGGEPLGFDVLLVATGARAEDAVPGSVPFWAGPGGGGFATVLDELRAGGIRRLTFAVPTGTTWALPLYELALLVSRDLEERAVSAELTLVTPETRPLAAFGGDASDAVGALLERRGIAFRPNTHPVAVVADGLAVAPAGEIRADAVVTVPALAGPHLEGLPADRHGFVPTTTTGFVEGLDAVLAAGDATSFPVKQGGLAAQQALVAATSIARRAGAAVERREFEPVLRGRLLTGEEPLFLWADLHGGRGETAVASTEALWWPPAKVFGRYVGPYLAARAEALTAA